ncbi:hypothetical protein EJ07DRAFT_167786 [Lizonia empirigonia]|nr:hypothetical protein EJ07DRAFT_167786 [Lizonia empirigonia]
MKSIDDLFKSHNGTKRKFENPIEADPSQAYKSVKLQGNTDVKRSAQVEDDEEDDEAGPSLPPDFEDEEPGDDEDGRFFGGGLDEHAKDAMDFLDAQDGRIYSRTENTDIAIGAIEIISELTDEHVVAAQEEWDALVAAFLEADLFGLLISNFSRFDETDETDASGIYHSSANLPHKPGPLPRDDPEKDSDERNIWRTCFNCLTSVVEEPIGKIKFLEAEGTELCLLLVRDGKTSKSRALKVLDHAWDSVPPHISVCERFVEARGLKPLFSTFMKTKRPDPTQTEHILASSPHCYVRYPFLESDFAKINKLITLRREYLSRLSAFDNSLEGRSNGLSKEEREELEVENIPLRLSEGLYALQRIDASLAWLVAEDDGAKKAIIQGLVGDR